ncbi:hypothetical protein SGLAD_v1c07490 [Spiroplasma gladiatoris]|uniref:DUF3899 domain-containing protein n=1 Tax=Spiroplasma gladiatoris TaxID=2143 RepID=A0A4P7AJG8_9MOLU|nr:hypothetical protein [Spiroplasma gladiatoris]QBQ07948.1 hypothetical protein SGLAD_v1c07490 [Spiroplasma gladiatoris]
MSKKNGVRQQLKDLSKKRKESFNDQVNDAINEIKSGGIEREIEYLDAKKLRWYDYLTLFFAYLIVLGISFLIGIYAFKDIVKTEYICTAISLMGFFIWLIMGYIRNRNTARYFNDARRRYDSTVTPEEGHNRRIAKIIFLFSILMLITCVVMLIVWNA